MAAEGITTPPVSQDVLHKGEKTLALRRYEAGAWLRKMVGVVVGKDLPAQPSEDEFRLGLRSGIILCKVLNKVKPHSVTKVVEAPGDSILIPDGEALSAYKYFENVRNFLICVKEMGLPTFETSDLEKGGKSRRIVNCVLALKSYKEAGGIVLGRVDENQILTSSSEQFARKIADLVSSSLSRNSLSREMSTDSLSSEVSSIGDAGLGNPGSLSTIVQELLVDKEQEDIPLIVENILSKLMWEFENRLVFQKEQMERLLTLQKEQQTVNEPSSTNEEARFGKGEESCNSEKDIQNTHMKGQSVRQQMLVERHQRDIQELKNVLNAAKNDMHLLKTTYEEEVRNLGEALSTIAERVVSVELGAAKSNKESSELRELKEQNASLEAALERKDRQMERSPYSSSPQRVMKSSASSSPSCASIQSSDVLSDRRQSMDVLSDCSYSMGGLTDHSQSMGGLSDHSQSMGGLCDRRQSMGGSSDRRQSMGGSSVRTQSVSGSNENRQSMGGSSDHRQSMGGSSDRRQSISGSNGSRQSMGGSSDRRQSMGGLSDHRQSKDGSESIEVWSNSTDKTKTPSLDLEDFLSWPAIGNPLPRGEDKDSVPGGWIEKVMVNKCDPTRGGSFQGRLENENGMQTNICRTASIPTSFGTKVKKTPPKSQGIRSSIPSPHGRRTTNGTNTARNLRSASYDGRRKTSSSK